MMQHILRKIINKYETIVPSLYRSLYKTYGMKLQINTNDSKLLTAIASYLSFFKRIRNAENKADLNIYLILDKKKENFAPPVSLSKKYLINSFTLKMENGKQFISSLYQKKDLFIFDQEGVSFICWSKRDGIALGFILNPSLLNSRWLERIFYTILLDLLETYGYFAIHAGAVAKGNKGIILTGPPEAGKSTLTFALVRAGFKYLAEDMLILKEKEGNAELYPLSKDFFLQKDSLHFFPEIQKLWLQGKTPLRSTNMTIKRKDKVRFRIDAIYQGCLLQRCQPHIILFPQITNFKKSRLEELSSKESLQRLIKTIICLSEEGRRKAVKLMSNLTVKTKGYILYMGTDIDDVVRQIESRIN